MQRLFGKVINNKVVLSSEDIHHLINVKRYKIGETLEVVDNDTTFLCRVDCLNPLVISSIKKIESNRELHTKITLGFALLKGDHNSLIVEKCTELGCYSFVPFISDRCVIKTDLGSDFNRIERLSKIIKGASEQSRRNVIPAIANTMSFKDAIKLPFKNKVIAYEGIAGESKTLLSYLSSNPVDDLYILIGPEGGFTKEEIDLALKEGFKEISLGKTILRGETACISSVAISAAYLGEKL